MMNPLLDEIEARLKSGGARETVLADVLAMLLAHFQSETGTIHRLDTGAQVLRLIAQKGLPPPVLEVVAAIPVGKGIAGQVVAQNQPVTICNLQADSGGVARPGARQTGVGGALCVRVCRDKTIVGTLGVGTARAYEYTSDETALLEEVGRLIAPLCAA